MKGIRCEDYMEALEEERHKIQVFHRELPLCLELVTQGIEPNRLKGAFRPFQRDEGHRASTATSTSTTAETVGVSPVNRAEEKQRQVESHKKARRSWSNELHKKFLNALQQLGGSYVATPKQIRELMKVDGLTNDEVKSHLQKYRLHTRRTSAAIHIKDNLHSTQLILVEGLLVQPEESFQDRPTTGDAAQLVTNGVYAPVAARPQSPLLTSQRQHKQPSTVHPESKIRGSQAQHCMEDEGTHSDHQSSSSSTQSTTVSVSLV
ncbi:hypothetical protein AQUCO_00201118v1 [Aquilegia coerulea]|uniref:HTH myb-type domain-containing protein n=1 Tax=Aquilegia coerulea TaxID=218851 RepID=A0A2G5F6C0_AQUCA|nr:hypothetical protein AQUCO_00201118v1 [Aquilegia coerulea]